MTTSHGRNGDRRIVVRFGDEVLEAGFTTVPNLVLEHYAALGITSDEMMFTIHVWQYWWTERDPYPSLSTIAAKMGKSWRTVHRYAKSLEKKQMLKITHRDREDGGQSSSEYDFEPMISAVVRSARTESSQPPAPSDSSDRGVVTGLTGDPLTAESDKENSSEAIPKERDSSKAISKDERGVIGNLMTDLARELNDQAPLPSTTSRAINIYRRSSIDLEAFVGLVYMARARTQQHTPSIQTGDPGGRNKMPYFFAVLEDLLLKNRSQDDPSD